MIESEGRGGTMYDTKSLPRAEYNNHVYNSDPTISSTPSTANIEDLTRVSSASAVGYYDQMSAENSPCNMSPWNQSSSPLNSPWSKTSAFEDHMKLPQNGLIGSLVREEGHIYSLATLGDLLYTGSDSKNIRVWKNMQEYSAFKSASGLVKAIVIAGEKIFTGHQDGKIRVWKVSPKNPSVHKRAGTLPKLKDIIKTSLNPSNYIDVGRHRTLWIKHFDAISCLSLNEDQGLLYSGSWDKTLKVWRISDSKCMESINAHDDAVNSVVAGFDGMVFTGSADGTVKVWRKETQPKGVKHAFVQTLLKQECAVTALALNPSASTLYCGSSDGVVNFWEREKQLSHGGVLKGHKLAVLCLATGGNLVFSGSADKSICVWRRDNGVHTCLSILTGHTGPVKCLSVERDQESSARDQQWIVYSGSLDKSVKVWKVAEQPPDATQMQQHQHSIEGLSPPDSSFSSTNSNSVSSSNRARNY